MRRFLGIFFCSTVLLSLGCSSTSTTRPTTPATPAAHSSAPFGYLITQSQLYSYAISATGAWTATNPASTGLSTIAHSMVATPNGRFLYVAEGIANTASSTGNIDMFSLDPATGKPTPLSPASVPTGTMPQGIAVDPTGHFLYTANTDDVSVSVFIIDQTTGLLTPGVPAAVQLLPPATPISPSSIIGFPESLVIHPSGRFLYVSSDGGAISIFSINPNTGALTPGSPAFVTSGDRPFTPAVSPNGNYLYVPNAMGNTISIYSINQTSGALTPATTAPTATGNEPTYIAINPAGTYAYVVNRQDNAVAMYSINQANGTLSALSTPKVGAGPTPYTLAMDPGGELLYVDDEAMNTASQFIIGANGELTSLSSLTTGLGPVGITLSTPSN